MTIKIKEKCDCLVRIKKCISLIGMALTMLDRNYPLKEMNQELFGCKCNDFKKGKLRNV